VNKIPVEFSKNYDYKEEQHQDPKDLYYQIYDKGAKNPSDVLKQASIDGFMPEITEKIRRDNY